MPSKRSKTKAAEAKATTRDNLSSKSKCEYCKKLVNPMSHTCTIGLRYMAKDEKITRMAYRYFARFYELQMNYRKGVDFSTFARSTLYAGFIQFAKYVNDINPVAPNLFVDFLIRNGVHLKNWTKKTVYETYLRELNKKETPYDAIERNFLLMQQWERETGNDWRDFFRKIPPAQATMWVISGRISPWILYTAPSAQNLLERMSNEQISLIETTIDPEFWLKRIENEKVDVESIVGIMRESGL
jgi:hypothetical protein